MDSGPDGAQPGEYEALPGQDQQGPEPQQRQQQQQGSTDEERISVPGGPLHSAARGVRDIFFLLLLPLLLPAAISVFATGVFPFLPPHPLQNLRLLLLMLLQGLSLLPATLLAFLAAWTLSLLLLNFLRAAASSTCTTTCTLLLLISTSIYAVSVVASLLSGRAAPSAPAPASPSPSFLGPALSALPSFSRDAGAAWWAGLPHGGPDNSTVMVDLCTPLWEQPRQHTPKNKTNPIPIHPPTGLPLLTPPTLGPLPLLLPLPLPLLVSLMLPLSGAPRGAGVRGVPMLPSAANSRSSTSLGDSGSQKWKGSGLSRSSLGAAAAAAAGASEPVAWPASVSALFTSLIWICVTVFVLSSRAAREGYMDRVGILLREAGVLLRSAAASTPPLLLLFTSAASYVLCTILAFFFCSFFVTWLPTQLPSTLFHQPLLLRWRTPQALPHQLLLLLLTGPGSVGEGEGGGDVVVPLQAILVALAAFAALLWLLLLSFSFVSFVAFFLLWRVKATPSALWTWHFCLSSFSQALRHGVWESGGTLCLASLLYPLLALAVSLPVLAQGSQWGQGGGVVRGAVLGMLDALSTLLSSLLSFFIFCLVLPCAAIFGDSFWGASARAWALVRGNVVEMVCVGVGAYAVLVVSFLLCFCVALPLIELAGLLTLLSSPPIGLIAFILSMDAGVVCFARLLQACVWALYVYSKALPAARGVLLE